MGAGQRGAKRRAKMPTARPIVVGIGLGLLALVGFALAAKAIPPPGGWCCPYNAAHGCFDTYGDLVAHVQEVHPGERIPLPIDWD